MATETASVLYPQDWQPLARRHHDRVQPLIRPRLQRRAQGQRHPVDDFLWEYYRLKPGQLATWHPGAPFVLAGDTPLAGHRDYHQTTGGWTANPEVPDAPRMRRNLAVVRATASRPVRSDCFGMHEWAMVHGQKPEEVRHQQVPLRVSPDRIAGVVAEVGLRCTHFDAYRFFTDTARTMQRRLTRADQALDEQPGCIHAGMDLYRYSYEALPWVGSDLVWDCLMHARDARDLDMRASPYDLTQWGLTAVPLENPAGRRSYAALQRQLAERAQELRARVIVALERIVATG